MVTTALLFRCATGETFRIPGGLIFRTHKVMNCKKLILLSCVVPCVFAVSTATAQMMGHRASTARMPMHRAPMLGPTAGMPIHRAPMLGPTVRTPMHRARMPGSTTRMPMHRAPMLNSTSSFQRSRGGDFNRNDRFRSFNGFNDGDFDRDDGFRRFNELIVFDNFAFPFFSSPPLFFPFFPPVFLF
jgi:hypothetical protein